MKKFYFFIGTSAELIKVIPVIKECLERKVDFKIISSGQNQIINDQLLSLLNIENVDIVLHQEKIKQSIFSLFFWFIKTLIKSLFFLRKEFKNLDKKNTVMIVHGDTVSTVMGALIGRFFRLRVVHLEAGLRSFNYFYPFPEEINRVITSKLTHFHFCPNQWALNNLDKKRGEKINTFQNTLADSLALATEQEIDSEIIKRLEGQKYFVFVLHRQENLYNEKLVNFLIDQVREISKEMKCVFVMHKLTKFNLEKLDLLSKIEGNPNIIIIPRTPYVEFMKIIEKSEYLITDGGSNQEESYYFGKPCLILRKATERTEGLDHNVVISGNDLSKIKYFVTNYQKYQKTKINSSVRPSEIIVNYLIKC